MNQLYLNKVSILEASGKTKKLQCILKEQVPNCDNQFLEYIAQIYIEDERFVKFINKQRERGLNLYISDAIKHLLNYKTLCVWDIVDCLRHFSILPIDTNIIKLINTENFNEKFHRQGKLGSGPNTEKISTRNSTDKASWGCGPTQRISMRNSTDKASWGVQHRENFNEKFYRQSKLGLNILIDLIQSCLFIFCENQIKLYLQILVYFDMMNRNIKIICERVMLQMKSKLWIVICALIVVLAACGQDANHSSNNKDTEKAIKIS